MNDLRMQLRGLRRDQVPATDLWPGIQARIARAPVATGAPRRGNHASRFAPWALAASLALVVGLAWRMQPGPVVAPAPAVESTAAAVAPLSFDREADAMALEYRAALQELRASTPRFDATRPEQPGLRDLDRGARQIRDALALNPQSRFLLERLRRTYALRLELAQRASLS